MTQAAPKKFLFDTVFDQGRVIEAPRLKRAYSVEEVEVVRQQAFAEGEASAVAQAQAAQAAAEQAISVSLADLAETARRALSTLTKVAHDHRAASAELALVCARKIAASALDQFPTAPVEAALHSLASEISTEPRLMIRVAPEQLARVEARLTALADHLGFAGQLLVRADPELPPAGFSFDWGDGRARFDPASAERAVTDALAAAITADSHHAEPLGLEPEQAP